MHRDKWVQLGAVGQPRGLRGEFRVSGRSEVIPGDLTHVWIGECTKSAVRLSVAGSRMSHSSPLLSLEECRSREDAVAICQQKIWIERELLALRPNEYLWQDLVGLPVWDFCGKQLGVIQKVYNFGASDCIEILGSTGTLDLPLVPVYFDLARMDEGIRCLLPLEALDDLWSRNASRSISHHTLSSKS